MNFIEALVNNDYDKTKQLLLNNKNIWKFYYKNKISILYLKSEKLANLIYDILNNFENDEINNKEDINKEDIKEEDTNEEDIKEEDTNKDEEDDENIQKIEIDENVESFKEIKIEEISEMIEIFKNINVIIYKAYYQNKQIILKKYVKSLNDETIREINYINKINNKYENNCVKLIGYVKNIDGMCLVMERLLFSLKDIYSIFIYFNEEQKEKLIEKWSNKIINKIYNINKLGINHNDLKSGNIMFDRYGEIKIIDFGISELLLYYQKKEIYTNYISTEYIKSPDIENTNKIFIYENNEHTIIKINKKNYSTDIYALGCVMLEGLINNRNEDKFIFIENNLYKYNNENKLIEIVINEYNIIKKIKEYMCINSKNRIQAKEINYGKTEIINKNISELIYMNYEKNYYLSYMNIYDNYKSEDSILYLNDIIENYNNKIKINDTETNVKEKILDYLIFYYMYNKKLSFDVIINILLNITSNITTNDVADLIFNYSAIFDYSYDIIKISNIVENYQPVLIYINEKIIRMQINNCNTSKIIKIENKSIKELIKYIVYGKTSEYRIKDIVEEIFENNEEKIKNDEISCILKDINNIKTTLLFNTFFTI